MPCKQHSFENPTLTSVVGTIFPAINFFLFPYFPSFWSAYFNGNKNLETRGRGQNLLYFWEISVLYYGSVHRPCTINFWSKSSSRWYLTRFNWILNSGAVLQSYSGQEILCVKQLYISLCLNPFPQNIMNISHYVLPLADSSPLLFSSSDASYSL